MTLLITMPPTTPYTCVNWVMCLIGLLLYLGDIGTDIWVAVQYLMRGYVLWFALTLTFVLLSTFIIQVFSYFWYLDDSGSGSDSGAPESCALIGLHFCQLGIFTRYKKLLKNGFREIKEKKPCSTEESVSEIWGMTADISMLKLFETHLESVPQLILQLYIYLEHKEKMTIQYLTLTMSFFSIAWSTVDYQRCLRRSLPNKREISHLSSVTVYLMYKMFTITSRVLSFVLLTILNAHFTLALFGITWLCTFIWAWKQQTDFCTSRGLEVFYRVIIGAILVFTFFNIKGQNTQSSMICYYALSFCETLGIVILCVCLCAPLTVFSFFLPICIVMFIFFFLGIIFLFIYYLALHPNKQSSAQFDEIDGAQRSSAQFDEVDGAHSRTASRINNFLQ
ncbi:XK-related protein 9 [Erpetoichthys calabaricus]|uniref:XK-related protein n=1 Tax=Erpetoichthys calabaricus TaxID=27687 RepID=A0A8C4X6X7_ERPCA|nr:XK-related protein 9 [Erpetoichthys calabaricus]